MNLKRVANECDVCGDDHAQLMNGARLCDECSWLITEVRAEVRV